MCHLSAPKAVYLPSNDLAVLARRTWDKASRRSVWVAAPFLWLGFVRYVCSLLEFHSVFLLAVFCGLSYVVCF